MSKHSTLKYIQISNIIISMIENGEFSTDNRIFSVAEIKNRFQVSITTAQRVITELEQKGYVHSRQGIGTFILPRQTELSAKNGQARTWGYVMPSLNNPSIYIKIIRGLEDIAHHNNINLIIANSDNDPEKEDAILQRMLESEVDGIAITPHMQPNPSFTMYLRLIQHHIPFVFCNRSVSGINAPLVTSDHKLGGYRATKYLIDQGYQRIGIISPPRSFTATERFGGYLKAMTEAGLEADESIMLWIESFEDLANLARIESRNLLETTKRPEAIFACADLAAFGFYQAMNDLGLICPDDIAIIGHDDVEPIQGMDIPLTTIRYPAYESGKLCGELLLRMHQGEALGMNNSFILQPEVMERETARSLSASEVMDQIQA